jgi:hypothetical protein
LKLRLDAEYNSSPPQVSPDRIVNAKSQVLVLDALKPRPRLIESLKIVVWVLLHVLVLTSLTKPVEAPVLEVPLVPPMRSHRHPTLEPLLELLLELLLDLPVPLHYARERTVCKSWSLTVLLVLSLVVVARLLETSKSEVDAISTSLVNLRA